MYRELQTYLKQIFPAFQHQNPAHVDYITALIPNCEALNQLALQQQNNQGKTFVFTPQDEQLLWPELSYEERIYQHGLIATRPQNWHDFFNALVWQLFPHTKATLNQIHIDELKHQKDNQRSPRRDALTLFDECGMIVISEQKQCLLDITQHRWQSLFIEQRYHWIEQKTRSLTFGHALYEKYLNPYIGMTAKVLLVHSPEPINKIPLVTLVALIDKQLSTAILKHDLLSKTSELAPFPVLGIPGWTALQNAPFYANEKYFCPLKQAINRPILTISTE